MSAAPILNISKDGETIKSVSIEGQAVLGRSEGCLIRLDDRAISRQHAVFTQGADGQLQVERKSEFAPLSVNGAECTRAVIKEGDVIEIGPYLMRLGKQTSSKSSAAPVVAPPPVPELAAVPTEMPTVADVESEEEPLLESLDDGIPADAQLAVPVSPSQSEQSISDQLQSLPDINLPDSLPDGLPINLSANMNESRSEPQEAVAEAVPIEAVSNHETSMEPPSFESAVDEDAKTKLLSSDQLAASLHFNEGAANFTEFEVKQEASLGRGKNCDIVLQDKKASRKHAVVRREGAAFFVKDLDSANGTFVNGVQINEQELYSDDVIRIGNTEFQFRALSQDYLRRQSNFMAVPEEVVEQEPMVPDYLPQVPLEEGAVGGDSGFGAVGQSPTAGIAGISVSGKKANQSLVAKFKALPKNRQRIMGVCLVFLAYFVFFDDDPPSPAPKAQTKVQVDKGPKVNTFDTLSEKDKKFVETEHDLAFDYYKNREYDKTLFELAKIFALIPDYKDSKELETYAKEGKRKLEVLEEERRKKEEEEKLKMRVADLVEQARVDMEKKAYEKAHDIFPQILALDPDNATVAEWAKVVDRFEEQKQMEEQARLVQEQINKRGWEIYREAAEFKSAGKFQDAIETFRKVRDIGATDKKLEGMVPGQIQDCEVRIAALRDPLLDQAKQSEDAQDFPKAYDLYQKATVVDPTHPAGFAGMARIRGILHDRAQSLYIEAVLAESYSDFTTSKKKFQECMDVAPKDDVYHDRAQRKLASFFKVEAAPQ